VRGRSAQAVRVDRRDFQRIRLLPHRLARVDELSLDGLLEREQWRIVVVLDIIDFDDDFVLVVLTPRPTTPGRPT